eukprot:jgi/Ulvmu1/8091/UM004_0330.1
MLLAMVTKRVGPGSARGVQRRLPVCFRLAPTSFISNFATPQPRSSMYRQRTYCVNATAGADGEIIERELHAEAKKSYLSYAMSVIVGRALPDARDGLKPVHRRILYAMKDLRLTHDKPFRKSARVVGDVLGKYHPHGDQAVYDALVRMAQPFAMGEMLVDGHGNFGSVDNDPAAAMRYTECRLRQLSEDLFLRDLDSAIVPFTDNFDASCTEPSVLPARLPQLLVNGSQGIAVGIATKIPPHNLREVAAAFTAYLSDPLISDEALLELLPGPDFPTGALMLPGPGIASAYATGKGGMIVRSKVHVESSGPNGTRSTLVVTELPYQVPKAAVIEEIAALVEKGTLTGISDIQDESDRDGMRVAIEVKRGSDAHVVLNNLFKHSRLQTRFSANMVALVDGVPEVMTLRRVLQTFCEFRFQVVQKRTEEALAQQQARMHIVEGFMLAVDNLDEVVKAIRAAADGGAAKAALQQAWGFSGEQADAVLNMSLRRLTGLAVGALKEEQQELTKETSQLQALLQDPKKINKVMIKEAEALVKRYGRDRRTVLADADVSEFAEPEELFEDERCLIIMSSAGYIKRVKDTAFMRQKRGGRGKTGGKLRDEDVIRDVLTTMSHDNLVFVAADGSCHTIRAFDVPERSRAANGVPVAELLPRLQPNISVAAVVPLRNTSQDKKTLLLLTKQGKAKRLAMERLRRIREGSTIMGLAEGDSICFASICEDRDAVMVACSEGKVATFPAAEIRVSSRTAAGVRGKKLAEGKCVVGASVLSMSGLKSASREAGPWLLMATSSGHGKRVPLSEFRPTARGVAGVNGIKLEEGTSIVNVHVVSKSSREDAGDQVSECLVASSGGMMSRIALDDISVYGRAARGVRVAKLAGNDHLCSITPCTYRHMSC